MCFFSAQFVQAGNTLEHSPKTTGPRKSSDIIGNTVQPSTEEELNVQYVVGCV